MLDVSVLLLSIYTNVSRTVKQAACADLQLCAGPRQIQLRALPGDAVRPQRPLLRGRALRGLHPDAGHAGLGPTPDI